MLTDPRAASQPGYGCEVTSRSTDDTSNRADATHLPSAVAAALAEPGPSRDSVIVAAGIPFAVAEWGSPEAPPLLLVHGVTSSSETWWRIGPALGTAGWRVVAPDQAGHGRTGHWQGHHRFADNAADLAALVRAAGLDGPELAVVGHSWGAVTVAWLPSAGIRPRRLVLLDPPSVPRSVMELMTVDPVERPYVDPAEARRVIAAAYPTWTDGDVAAKAAGLSQFDEAAVRAVLLDNGDWDGGLAGLETPEARTVDAWVIRGDPAEGGLLPDDALPAFRARLGPERVLTVSGAPHSPHRTHPEATLVALLRALGSPRAA
jgi:pimeloyl-ACP methyl ester carboxylesterase